MDFAPVHIKAGGRTTLGIIDKASKQPFAFTFIGEQSKERLQTGALYPILAAFRWMVEEDASGDYRWRGGFGNVLRRWSETAPDLVTGKLTE